MQIVAASIFGWWLDWVKGYHYFLLWNVLFTLLGLFATVKVYRQWWVLVDLTAIELPEKSAFGW